MAAINLLRRLIDREPGPVGSLIGVSVCVAAPTAARVALDALLPDGLLYVTYFPAVLLAGVLMGWRHGLVVLLISGLAGDRLFAPAHPFYVVDPGELWGFATFMVSGGAVLLTAALLRGALARLNRATERERHLNRELQHRVRNNLAVAQGLAYQAMRATTDPAVFYSDFQGRLMALARAHDVLSSGDWITCELPELAEAALEAFMGSGTITIGGSACMLPGRSCVPLALALHELATNAVKHGALSVPGGGVSLSWRFGGGGSGRDLVLEWVERGGPPVIAPERRGLGSRLLVQQSGLDEVKLEFDPAGLRCAIVVHGVTVGGS